MKLRFGSTMSKGMRIALYWLVLVLAVILDQTTKAAAREVLADGPRVLIPGVINLVHVENTGAAFSIGEGGGVIFILIALAFIVASSVIVVRTDDLPSSLVIFVGLVAGGGLGNMIDRIIDGSVTDFIATAFMNFPVFNVADMCVTVGVALSVVGFWVWDSHREEEPEHNALGEV